MRKILGLLLAVAAPLIGERICISNHPDVAAALAAEVYVYGYPLVTMEMTRRVMTNVAEPDGVHAPMGQFAHARGFPTAGFRDVTAPNSDTLYSTAWLDLGDEPYLLQLPSETDRYFVISVLSGWSDVIASIGTRTGQCGGGTYAIVGPRWQGLLPCGVEIIRSPTDLVWIVGRTYTTGTEADLAAVAQLQDKYALTPLMAWGRTDYCYSPGNVNRDIDMKTAVRDQVNRMDAVTYFNTLADALADNPPRAEDGAMVVKMAQIGLVPGHCYVLATLSPCMAAGVVEAPSIGQRAIMGGEDRLGMPMNGWNVNLQTGSYQSQYMLRAATAAMGLGANLPQDAIYPYTDVDWAGNPLTGDQNYVMTFPRCATPPVKGFWSLTLYDDQYFFAPNPINRYSINPRNPLRYNPDGSLTIYIQNASPGGDLESNWLPSPQGKFNLMLRLYWPDESVLNGEWQPPMIMPAPVEQPCAVTPTEQ